MWRKVLMVLMVMVALVLSVNVTFAQDEGEDSTWPTAEASAVPALSDVVAGGDVSDVGGLSDETVAVVVDLLKDGQETVVGAIQAQNTLSFVILVVVVCAALFVVYKAAAGRVPIAVFEQMRTLSKDVVDAFEREAQRRLEIAKLTPSKLDDAGFAMILSLLREAKGLVGSVPAGGGDGVVSAPSLPAVPTSLDELQRMYKAWGLGLTYDPNAKPPDGDGAVG